MPEIPIVGGDLRWFWHRPRNLFDWKVERTQKWDKPIRIYSRGSLQPSYPLLIVLRFYVMCFSGEGEYCIDIFALALWETHRLTWEQAIDPMIFSRLLQKPAGPWKDLLRLWAFRRPGSNLLPPLALSNGGDHFLMHQLGSFFRLVLEDSSAYWAFASMMKPCLCWFATIHALHRNEPHK